MTFKAGIRRTVLPNGQVRYLIFCNPADVAAELEQQGHYPEICLNVDVDSEEVFEHAN